MSDRAGMRTATATRRIRAAIVAAVATVALLGAAPDAGADTGSTSSNPGNVWYR